MKRYHGRLHSDRKFQIFIFLIGYINVNKGVFCLIISYLRIKSYNVLNNNNCSTDWSFRILNCCYMYIVYCGSFRILKIFSWLLFVISYLLNICNLLLESTSDIYIYHHKHRLVL